MERYIIPLFDYNRPTLIQAVIAEQVFKFQHVRGDAHIHIATQNTLTFLSKWHFVRQCKNVSKSPLTFGTEILLELLNVPQLN